MGIPPHVSHQAPIHSHRPEIRQESSWFWAESPASQQPVSHSELKAHSGGCLLLSQDPRNQPQVLLAGEDSGRLALRIFPGRLAFQRIHLRPGPKRAVSSCPLMSFGRGSAQVGAVWTGKGAYREQLL